jgi:tetratricopeptide (TPR) repeat protein
MKYSLQIIILTFMLFSCKSEKSETTDAENHLGTLQHDFTLSSEAKDDFEKGLLLIHSFEYDDANTSFQAAKAKDSTEIMVYWGEAMSHYKALWGLQDKRAGYAVMEELGTTKEERLAKISDPIEVDFWNGLEILYGDGSLEDRNGRFNEHMGLLHQKYPKNQEAAAFYALSMMWTNNKDEDPTEVGKKSAEVVKGILSENALHPGALHYTIHAYDNPIMANKALEVANKYSKVAPDATHALHMPSHIYLALGMWHEVVSSNEVSYAASVKRMEKLELDDDARGYHSYAWLHYAYLQQGRVEDAIRLLKDLKDYYANTQSKGIRSYIASMQASQLFETGEWPEELEVLEIEKSDLGLGTQMRTALFDTEMALLNGKKVEIAEYVAELESEIEKAELYVSEDKSAMCSAGPSRYAPNEDAITKAKVVLNIMKAKEAIAREQEGVEDLMKEAVSLETSSEYSFGPADISLPSFEFYGYWLLDNERNEEALEQFEKSLERAPKRRNALIGKQTALEKLGMKAEAEEINSELEGFTGKKDLTQL